MEHRGLILILFSLMLILAPFALQKTGPLGVGGGVRQTQTIGAAQAACDAESLQIRNLRLGCRPSQMPNLGHRLQSGGAVFLSARN